MNALSCAFSFWIVGKALTCCWVDLWFTWFKNVPGSELNPVIENSLGVATDWTVKDPL